METVIIYQPYLSTRKLSSNTIDRQFRFLTCNKNRKIYALFGSMEKEYVESLENTWFEPILENIENEPEIVIENIIEKYKPDAMYIARTYFTPCKPEDIENLRDFDSDKNADWRIARNFIPLGLANHGIKINHMVYDPLEVKYDDLIDKSLYQKYSSMNNVEGALPHMFADFGYYDKDNEVPFEDKNLLFVFGGTSFEEKRAKQLHKLHSLAAMEGNKVYIRTKDFDNLIPNEQYEDEVSRALFTYTLPSYDPKHMSFTRMLLALSQGTIPLLHPDNNIDCLFGRGFDMRDTLKPFFKKLIMYIGDLKLMLENKALCEKVYKELLADWHNTDYYQWLKDRV